LLIKGKKSKSYKIVDNALNLLSKKLENLNLKKNDPFNHFFLSKIEYLKKGDINNLFFEEAIIQLNPLFKFKRMKFGSRTELIPVYLTKKEQIIFALKLLISQSKKRPEKNLSECLCNEIIDICFNKSNKLKKTRENLKLAYINRRLSTI
jgi:ribosomal protein S7